MMIIMLIKCLLLSIMMAGNGHGVARKNHEC